MLKKIGFAVAGFSLFASPLLVSADTLSDLQMQVQALLSQIAQMKSQSQVGSGSTVSTSPAMPSRVCPQILRSLVRGSRGDDVMNLQAHLGVSQTGYFGPLTASAVAQFQASEGLSQIGFVGPLTRAAFARRCGNWQKDSFSASPTFGAAPLPVNFTYAPNVDDAGTYYIDFGDGGSQVMNVQQIYCIRAPCISPSVASHTYRAVGTYTASVSRYIACLYATTGPRCLMAQPAPLATVLITVTNGSTAGAPSISGVDGPTTLQVNHQGTWSVHVNDSSGYLSYSVRWGDEAPLPVMYGATASMPVASSGTFTHIYATAGTYSPTFTVTNGNGQSTSASATVEVGGATNQTLSAIPTSGAAPLTVSFSANTGGASYFGGYNMDYGDHAQNATGYLVSCGYSGTPLCPSHTYTQPGTYAAHLYGTGENSGGYDYGTVTITVY